jgi:probable 2-oxoglutarate dehydrogenase E1 component DHKTD1
MSGFRGKTLDAGHLAKGTKFDFGRGVLNFMPRRHAMFVDQKTESVVVPLNTALSSHGKLELANSL